MSERELSASVFRAAIEEGTRNTGVFGLRMQRDSFAFFSEQLAVLLPGLATDHRRIEAAFGPTAFIHLTRDDKLAQAISYVRAEQSGLWHMLSDGTELERLSAPQEPSYDAERIRSQIERFRSDDDAWKNWFAQERIVPLGLTYELLCRDPKETIGQVFDHIGLDRSATVGIRPDVMKLADSTSRDWAQRFRAEHPE